MSGVETLFATPSTPLTIDEMTGQTHSASRVILAKPRAIFRALLDPEVVPKWRAPTGMDCTILAFNAKVGGGYRMQLTYHDPAGAVPKSTADSDIVDVTFAEILPDERVVEEVTFEASDSRFAGTMAIITTLKPVQDGTKVTIVAANVPPGISEDEHRKGMESSLKNLANFLE